MVWKYKIWRWNDQSWLKRWIKVLKIMIINFENSYDWCEIMSTNKREYDVFGEKNVIFIYFTFDEAELNSSHEIIILIGFGVSVNQYKISKCFSSITCANLLTSHYLSSNYFKSVQLTNSMLESLEKTLIPYLLLYLINPMLLCITCRR